MRSEHGETSEAIFLTSGYTYDDAETVAARFAGEADGMPVFTGPCETIVIPWDRKQSGE